MATKDEFLFSKDKHQSFSNDISPISDNDCNRNSIQSLNQSYKFSLLIPVQYYSKPCNNKNYDSTVSDSYEEKRRYQTWNKSTDLCLNTLKFIDETGEIKKNCKESSPPISKSTLSLHITAYENSLTAFPETFDVKSNKNLEKKGSITKHIIFTASTFIIQNSFEFPRQQNDNVSEPELFQYKAFQQLLNPNETAAMYGFMYDSDNESGPPSLPQPTNDEENVTEEFIAAEDSNISVQNQIHNLIQLLSNYIGDLCNDERMSYDKMEEYNQDLKNCLASIESGLSEQMNVMEEFLMSTDANCCSALYDNQIEDMNEMLQEFTEICRDKVLSLMNAPSA